MRACSTAPRALCPKEWIELGLPYSSLKYGIMAASTSGAIGVVAFVDPGKSAFESILAIPRWRLTPGSVAIFPKSIRSARHTERRWFIISDISSSSTPSHLQGDALLCWLLRGIYAYRSRRKPSPAHRTARSCRNGLAYPENQSPGVGGFIRRYWIAAFSISAFLLIPCFWRRYIVAGNDLDGHSVYNAWLGQLISQERASRAFGSAPAVGSENVLF